jgi:hypothetical protein
MADALRLDLLRIEVGRENAERAVYVRQIGPVLVKPPLGPVPHSLQRCRLAPYGRAAALVISERKVLRQRFATPNSPSPGGEEHEGEYGSDRRGMQHVMPEGGCSIVRVLRVGSQAE